MNFRSKCPQKASSHMYTAATGDVLEKLIIVGIADPSMFVAAAPPPLPPPQSRHAFKRLSLFRTRSRPFRQPIVHNLVET
jgi:hypothetical protein